MIQCQMLSEPILQPSKHLGQRPSLISTETRLWRCQKQGLTPGQMVDNTLPLTGNIAADFLI
jgi:hypothetical protein